MCMVRSLSSYNLAQIEPISASHERLKPVIYCRCRIAVALSLNRAAVGWAVSCSAFGLFYFFLNRAAVGWAVSCSAFGLFFIF